MNTASLMHAFISYSHKDHGFAKKLATALEKKHIPVWIDSNLDSSKPTFEAEIRKAIDASFTFILVATPDSLASLNVQGEIDIALGKNKSIYVVWANGEIYSDTVPAIMTKKDYQDCRGDKYKNGLARLIDKLTQERNQHIPKIFSARSTDKCPRSHFSLKIEANRILVQPDAFSTIREFLDVVYVTYLASSKMYPPFTYGDTWVIGSVGSDQGTKLDFRKLALDWSWLNPSNPLLPSNRQPKKDWRDKPLKTLGLEVNTSWEIIHIPFKEAVFGIVTNDDYLIERLNRLNSYDNLDDAYLGDIVMKYMSPSRAILPEEVDIKHYKYHAILSGSSWRTHSLQPYFGKVVIL